MSNRGDSVNYPSIPDRYVGSTNDGDSPGVKFIISNGKAVSDDIMPIIKDAYIPRYKEYR